MMRLLLIIFFFIPMVALAVTDEFTISVQVENDTTPPTTPVLLSATATAATQVDLMWSTSTDDTSVGGYVVLRDSSAVATTTSTTYSDTGLSSDTLYTYSVYAFDLESNNSTTSNALSTTTLSLPSSPTTGSTTSSVGSGSGSTKTVKLQDISVLSEEDSVNFNWKTYGYSRYALYWGETDDYNDGYITNDVYKEKHETVINNLKPDTLYMYKLVGYTPAGLAVTLKLGQFRTKQTEKETPPPNVRYLQAQVEGDDVRLSWRMPLISEAKVRVVRNHYDYPVDINDGLVVYEGRSNEVLDKLSLQSKDRQYYTVFVIDKKGRVSSGAITQAFKIDSGTSEQENIYTNLPTIDDLPSGFSKTPTKDGVDVVFESPEFRFDPNNIKIIQSGVENSFLDNEIYLSHEDVFTISIPFGSLPDHLKSIIVTIVNPTDQRQSYSFLLRLNTDKTAYEATIAPLNVAGRSHFQVRVLDYESRTIGLYSKSVNFFEQNYADENDSFGVTFLNKLSGPTKNIIWVVGLLIFLIILFSLRRRT